ncbi:MAG: chemotaxis protein CheW [Coleofasciculaceae cyanobacterium]
MTNEQLKINNQQFLGFYLSPEIQVMLPTQHLAKILSLELTTIVPIPDMPEAVVGVCPWQGEVLWLIDIAYLLGSKPILMPDYNQTKCNVLKVTTQGFSLGLVVYKIGQLVKCDLSQIRPASHDEIKPHLNSYYQTNWLYLNEESLPILDVEAVRDNLSLV